MSDQHGDGQEPTRTEILAALDRFGDLLWSRDAAMIEEFADAADITLVGSDADEVAHGRNAIAPLIGRLFELPVRLRWDWNERFVSVSGDIAWFFAACEVVVVAEAREVRKPYRMTGVLQRTAGGWRWRQFHGSQPAG